MDLLLSDTQKWLQNEAKDFLKEKSCLLHTRKALEDASNQPHEIWREMADLGFMAITIPKEYGGLGLDYISLCLLAKELGRKLYCGPFSSSIYLASEAMKLAGSHVQKEAYLPAIAKGEKIGCLAVTEKAGHETSKSCQTICKDSEIYGEKIMVVDGCEADFAIVLAKEADMEQRRSLYLVSLRDKGVLKEPMKTIDGSRPHARLVFNKVKAELLGGRGDGVNLIKNIYDRAATLFAFEQLGGAEAALFMARDYSLIRYSFGRPIGSYQAIKHKLAKVYVENTLAKSNCFRAAYSLNENKKDLPLASAAARVSSTKAYLLSAKENIQTHGGNGFTHEYDCHLYYRRAKMLASNLGDLTFWKDRLVSELEADSMSYH